MTVVSIVLRLLLTEVFIGTIETAMQLCNVIYAVECLAGIGAMGQCF